MLDEQTGEINEPTREKGRTTNRLFNSMQSFTQVLGNEKPTPVADKDPGTSDANANLQYIFSNESGLSLVIDRVGKPDALDGTHILNPQVSFEATAPFYLTGIELPQPNQIFKKDISSIVGDDLGGQGLGQGSIFADGTHFKILQAGFANVEEKGFDADIGEVIDVNVVRREPDNFLLVEVRPAKVDERVRDNLKEDFTITAGNVNDPDGFRAKYPGFSFLQP